MAVPEVFEYPKGWRPVTSGRCRNGDSYLSVPDFDEGRIRWKLADPDDYDAPYTDFDLLIRKES